MTKKTLRPDDRAIGAAVVAGLFAAVGAGMSAVVWEFGINETGAVFIVLAALIFLVLMLGWRSELPPPGTKKAPTVPASHSVLATSSTSASAAPSAPATSATSEASSSGTALAAQKEAAPEPKAEPAPAAASSEGTRPAALDGPRDGTADDLKQIKGVGPALERLCNSLGFYHFDQIAAWTAEEVSWVDQNLEGFKGRVTRDDWVAQAKTLAAGGSTDFSEKVEKGDVY